MDFGEKWDRQRVVVYVIYELQHDEAAELPFTHKRVVYAVRHGLHGSSIPVRKPRTLSTLRKHNRKRHVPVSFKSQNVSRTRLHTASEGRKQGSNCMRYQNPLEPLQFVSPSPRGFPLNTHRTCLFSYHVRDQHSCFACSGGSEYIVINSTCSFDLFHIFNASMQELL